MGLRRWVLGWLLCALVGAQVLGFMHRVAHVPEPAAPAAAALPQAGQAHAAHAHADLVHGTGWLADLFRHVDEHGCRLLDGLAQSCAPLPVLASPPLLPAVGALFAGAAVQAVPGWPAPFHARAPPSSR